jgi:DNA-binding NtrC family response regulator
VKQKELDMAKILVIDDERPTLNMFRLFLNAYGHEVLTAETGASGLEIFQREKPLIVFTDVKMPGMDGLEVVRKIKEIEPKTRVIVMTGHGDSDLAVQASHLEAAAFINKPISRSALETALRQAGERVAGSEADQEKT